MAIEQPYTTYDGFAAMTKGMHSGLDPRLLDSNGQFAYGVNVTTRGGTVGTRPAFAHLGKVGDGLFQGAATYSLDESDHIVFCVSGRVVVRNGTTGALTEIAGRTMSATADRVFMTQVYRWMVVQDGVSRPIVVEESGGEFSLVARDAVLDPESQAPRICVVPGTIGAYAHGRYHFVPSVVPAELPSLVPNEDQSAYVNLDKVPYPNALPRDQWGEEAEPYAGDPETGRGCFVSSDIVDVLSPLSVFRMTEHRGLDEGGAYSLPAELGFIHGMGAMRGAATGTGVGSLYVFGSRGVSAFEVSPTRSSQNGQKGWKDIAFSQVAFYGAGTYSPWSIVNLNDDIWYVDAQKYLRSIYYDSTQLGAAGYAGSAQFNTTKSFETERWVRRTSDGYRPFLSAATAGNRLHWTLCEGRALASIDFAQTYTAAPSEIPALHEGIWTGFDFARALTANDALHVVVRQGTEVHLLRLDADAVNDPGGRPIEAFIVTKQYGGMYNEQYWYHKAKTLSHAELQLSGVSRGTSLSVWYRPDHYPAWTLLGTREFNVPSGAPQVRTRVRFAMNPATMSGCNPATKEALHVGHAFQFRIAWTGRAKIDRFVVAAPVLDEAPRPQCQVDNAALAAYPDEEFQDLAYEVTL